METIIMGFIKCVDRLKALLYDIKVLFPSVPVKKENPFCKCKVITKRDIEEHKARLAKYKFQDDKT